MNAMSPRVVITGAGGFLGFHARALLEASDRHVSCLSLGSSYHESSAVAALEGAERLIHCAGVNRGSDIDIRDGNLTLAHQLAAAFSLCEQPPLIVVFANTTQVGNGSVYGQAKQAASDILRAAVERVGSTFIDISLPNLFGEHGKPFYNSVTATFCHLLARRQQPVVAQDKALTLLHAQHAAEILTGERAPEAMASCQVQRTVSELLTMLTAVSDTYRNGDIPLLESAFDRDLFNTYRSHLLPQDRVIKLNRNADDRGSFFEVVRAQGGSGQTSFSTTHSGVTRGQHYHRRKIERFAVLSGQGQISMRRLFTNDVLTFNVDGLEPVAIDMPTMWAHNVSNSGKGDLYTLFWTNEIFDSDSPDTYPEEV